MPGTTPVSGYPYALPTDPIANGADAIKNLALAIDGRAMVAYPSNDVPVPSSNVSVIIPWNTEEADHSTPYHDTAVNPSRLLAPETGVYMLAVHALISGNIAGGARGLEIRRNAAGSNAAGTQVGYTQQIGVAISQGLDLTRSLKLNAGDHVEVFVKQTSSQAGMAVAAGPANSFISFHRIA